MCALTNVNATSKLMQNTTKGNPVDFTDMKLPELKAEAKARKIKGFSTMKKAELVQVLTDSEPKATKESFIDGIKAAFANMRQDRTNKGRKAGSEGKVTTPQLWQMKDLAYRLQRGSETARLTPAQLRRLRKAERKAGTVELTYS